MRESRKLLENIISALVTNTDEIEINETTDEMGVLLTLYVAKEDMGKVIGKNGDTAKAIRTLLRVSGAKENAKVSLKIAEPNE